MFFFEPRKTTLFNNDSHPETIHKHVPYILNASSNSNHKHQKTYIRLHRLGTELALYKRTRSPLCKISSKGVRYEDLHDIVG